MIWVAVVALGAVGALGRFALDTFVSGRTGRRLPYGTLAVNLSGAFVLGVLAGATLSADAYRLAGTALIGSYTTFSTWMLETQRLTEEGQWRDGLANVVASLALGLLVAELGRRLGAQL
ncbi:MAG TPA: fluoride efflux transporter CrcB [Solirubrobacter sp.]|nr:fluoride efflux transporter CrcB [Solirubrobacter sp.]